MRAVSPANIIRLQGFALRPRGPRRRTAAEPGVISLRSITPAKAAYAATDIVFFLFAISLSRYFAIYYDLYIMNNKILTIHYSLLTIHLI